MTNRIGHRFVALLLAVTLAGCAGAPSPAAPQGKRLSGKGVCDLVDSAELAKAIEKITDEYRSSDGRQCYFYLDSPASAAIDQGVDKARGGDPIEVDGVSATKLEKKGQCAIDVWLVPGDLNQQFTVNAGTCDRSLTLARLVLDEL